MDETEFDRERNPDFDSTMKAKPPLVLFLLACLVLPATGAGSREKPNIVIILADDLGWTGLGCYGSDLHETPHLDRFAEASVRFTQAYAASTVCTPTRASIQTGLHPARLHLTIWRESAKTRNEKKPMLEPLCEEDLKREYLTVAELLKGAGYITAHLGKWHLGAAEFFPEAHGYDISIGGNIWGAPESFWHPYKGDKRFGKSGFRYVPDIDFSRPGDYLTDKLTDEALRVIDFAGEDPFFLNLCYYTVHTPIEGKPEDVEYFKSRIGDGMEHRNAHYAAMHKSLDENVGRVFERIRERGIEDRTVVFFLSDNGGFEGKYEGEVVTNNKPLRSGKGSLYEGGVRIPFMVRWPGKGAAGEVCEEPVVTTDLLPTIAAITNTEKDLKKGAGKLDGIDISKLIVDPAAKLGRDEFYFHYPHYYSNTSPVSAVRIGDWKLLHYYEDRHVELYNLATDLGETKDLSKEQPEKVTQLSAKLNSWLDETRAQFPTENSAAPEKK